MSNEKISTKLKFFGRFPKTNFAFDSKNFIEEYMKIIYSDSEVDKILQRMIYRYGTNDLKKAAIIQFIRESNDENLSTEKICELFQCDKNTIFSIGQEMEISIRLFIQKRFYESNGRMENMIDELGLTSKSFNYIYKRGCITKNAIVEAYKNGYITNEKVKSEIYDNLINKKSDDMNYENTLN